MGITTGTCFTGVCGTIGNRREYSLLGEITNLSARHMQKAIYYAKEKKLDYCVLLDNKTKDLIQNKIRCEYVCEDELKGFTMRFNFYTPRADIPLSLHISIGNFILIRALTTSMWFFLTAMCRAFVPF